MQLVIDASILFAALVRDATTRKLVLSDMVTLVCPEFAVDEFMKHKTRLAADAGMEEEALVVVLEELLRLAEIDVLPAEEYADALQRAVAISPDPNDAPYIALACKLGCPIWSNDARLKQQSSVRVPATRELLDVLSS